MLALVLLFGWAAAGETPPRDARRAFDLGSQCLKAKRPDQARKQFEKAVSLHPAYAQAWFELGRLQDGAREAAAARQSFERALAADPRFLDAYIPLARLLQADRDWKRLVDVTGRLLKLDPVDYVEAWLGNAVGRYHLGDLPGAEECVRTAQQMDPGRRYPQSWQLLGVILEERGDLPGACQQWTEFLKHAPNASVAPALRAKLDEVRRQAGLPVGDAAAGATFRSDTELVLTRFQVSPKRGRFVTDLRAEDIEIREDGVAQQTAVFEGGRFYPRRTPLEITLLFDASGSVQSAGNLNPHVFEQSLLDEYEHASIAIYAFSDMLERMTGPTRHPQVLAKAMRSVLLMRPGTTPLFEYIGTAALAAAVRPGAVRMLVVFSDGESAKPGDTGMVGRAVAAAQDAGVAIYPVMLTRPLASSMIPMASVSVQRSTNATSLAPMPSSPDKQFSIMEFLKLARETGGEKFEMTAGDEALPEILKKMARRLQFDYVAGYYPAASAKSRRRRIEVVLKAKGQGEVVGGKRTVVR